MPGADRRAALKLRVLHLITRLPVGGAERLLVDVARGLDPQRFTSVVCCIQERGELAAELEACGIAVHCLERMRTKRFDWRAIGDLGSLMREQRIDVVHSHLYHANLYGRLAARRARVPAVATVHNTYAKRKLHRELLNRWLAHISARVIAVSENVRSDLIRYDGIPAQKITVIHNGIDVGRVQTPLTRGEARERLGLAADTIVLGCVARLEEQKGHRFLLEALAQLNEPARGAARFRVVLVGDGRLRAQLEERAAGLGVAAWTMFLGTRHDVPDILKALDICVMPSLWEGLSVAMLEAMAAGLPLVISDVSGVSQVVGDNEYGLKVPAGDAAELARAIARLADAPERRAALGAAARRRVRAKFSAQAMLAELARLYEEVSSRRS
jgi:glycosyltransferase involved in cell wall biosynthesis